MKVIIKIELALLLLIGLVISTPVPIFAHFKVNQPSYHQRSQAISVTTLGTNTSKSVTDPWTAFSSITLNTGDFLILCFATQPVKDFGSAHAYTWNGNAMGTSVSTATASTYGDTGMAYYYVTTGGTGDVVINWSTASTPSAVAVTLYKATGIVSSSPVDKGNYNYGAGTTATTNSTGTLSQSDELIIAVTNVLDEVDDAHGSWSTSSGYVYGNEQFAATNGSVDTSNIQCHSVAMIVSATTSMQGSDGTHDSSTWSAKITSFKMQTAAAPTVTQQAFSSVLSTTATANGNITDGGGSSISERGVCYNTTGSPTTADSTFHDHTDATGAYTESMSTLTAGQIYHTKMYAVNTTGTGYSSETDFYTLPGNPASLASGSQTYVTIAITWTQGTGGDKTMIRYRSDGTYPTGVADGTQGYFDTGTSTTISSLSAGTTYKIRAWAYDSDGTQYSNGTTDLTQATLTFDIVNEPASKAFGIVATSMTYYAKGSAPANPVVEGNCTFQLANNGTSAIKVNIHSHNFSGGVGWSLGTPAENTARLTAYYEGQNPASGVVLTTSDQQFIASLAASTHTHWDFKIETPTSVTDGVQKTTTITLSAAAP